MVWWVGVGCGGSAVLLESRTVPVRESVSQAVRWCSKPMPPLWASHEGVMY